ncbi:NCAIR mutase (PurE)-like protein [Clostridium tetanomorphum]|nr:NCAIR mutase (PurE)-like protein [Clostridium tetanomorphum]
MNENDIKELLENIKSNRLSIEDGVKKLKELPFKDLGYAKIDNHREIRVGYPEVIYCEGKTVEQIKGIIQVMLNKNNNILATRANEEMYNEIKNICNDAEYFKEARIIRIIKNKLKRLIIILP